MHTCSLTRQIKSMNYSKLEVFYSFGLSLAIVLNFLLYAHEFCYTVLISKHRNVNLAFAYLAFESLMLIFVLWFYFLVVFSAHKPINNEYFLNKRILKVDSTLTVKQNRCLENQLKKRGLLVLTRNAHGQVRVCVICNIIQPDRAYHCKKCGKCILKRDHHCPWLYNCIGFSNQKYFVLFLLYLLVYTCFILVTMSVYVLDSMNLIVLFGVDFSIVCVNLFLLLNNFYLCSKNVTSIEENFPPRMRLQNRSGKINQLTNTNIFDLGQVRLNLELVFGKDFLLAFLPLWTSLGDGHVFPTKQDFKTRK